MSFCRISVVSQGRTGSVTLMVVTSCRLSSNVVSTTETDDLTAIFDVLSPCVGQPVVYHAMSIVSEFCAAKQVAQVLRAVIQPSQQDSIDKKRGETLKTMKPALADSYSTFCFGNTAFQHPHIPCNSPRNTPVHPGCIKSKCRQQCCST